MTTDPSNNNKTFELSHEQFPYGGIMGERINDIGKRIRFLRDKFNVSQSELAHEINVPQSTFWDWDSGRRTLQYEELTKVALYFDKLIKEKYPNGLYVPEGLFGKDAKRLSSLDLQIMCVGANATVESLERDKQELHKQLKEMAIERAAGNPTPLEEYLREVGA